MNTGASVGIDLGTTYSAIAWVNPSGRTEVIQNSDGYTTTPSVVFDDGDTILVGREAVRAASLDPSRAAECFKRDMGLDSYHDAINERNVRPEELSAYVLRKLKQDAEDVIGEIQDAVVTVPAFFDDTRRKATQDSARIAGLNILEIINEPVAAALWHGCEKCSQPGTTFLIYDLGGGTFDATLMEVTGENKFKTIATDGAVTLGGKDWNRRLMDYIAEEVKKQGGIDIRKDPTTLYDLSIRTEEAKRTLSKIKSVNVPINCGNKIIKVPITRQKFEELTASLLNQTRMTVELLLSESGYPWDKIDNIIMVGGSSHMPMVEEMLTRLSNRKVERSHELDLAVVQGAAIYASALRKKNESVSNEVPEDQIKLTNVNSHSLGLEIENEKTSQIENHIIIPKNSPLPCETTNRFGLATAATQESAIEINILEGEAKNPEACIKIGMCTIDGLPPGLPAGSPVDVTFSYTQDGRIHVKAVAIEAGREAATHIKSKHGLSEEEAETHSRKLLKLKIV